MPNSNIDDVSVEMWQIVSSVECSDGRDGQSCPLFFQTRKKKKKKQSKIYGFHEQCNITGIQAMQSIQCLELRVYLFL